jgi:hypothetical protein
LYDSARGRATFRGRKREFLVRKPDAGEPHVRFDERGVETGHEEASEAPATERVGNRWASSTLLRHIPTLHASLNPTFSAMRSSDSETARSQRRSASTIPLFRGVG